MVSMPRRPLDPAEARDFVGMIERHRADLVRYHMRLPLKSPARAAIGTLLEQQAEIVGILTGDRGHFHGKAPQDFDAVETINCESIRYSRARLR